MPTIPVTTHQGDTEPVATTAPAIAVKQLCHRYPPRRTRRSSNGQSPATQTTNLALDHVSLAVEPGEIFGILGPNGGGKTTLFRIIATMLRPSSGAVQVFGHDVRREPAQVRRQLGVVFQAPSLDVKLTARENLTHQGHLYGLRGSDLRHRIDAWLDRVGLSDRADDFAETFSGGMRRRVELAKALLHEPRLLLLDEPATGLDLGARRDVWRHLTRLRDEQGVTAALTTHLMDEADHCDRLAIISHGKLVAIDTPGKLKATIGGDVITIRPRDEGESALLQLLARITEQFGPWRGRLAPTIIDGAVHLEKEHGPAFVAQLGSALAGEIHSITVGQPTLEDVFLHLTGATFDEADRGEPA